MSQLSFRELILRLPLFSSEIDFLCRRLLLSSSFEMKSVSVDCIA